MNVYEIRDDNGHWSLVQADSRKKAVETYREIHGMPKDYVIDHCKVKNLGRVVRDRWVRKK